MYLLKHKHKVFKNNFIVMTLKKVKSYKLFLESYEDIMKDMASEVDVTQIENAQKEIERIKEKIEDKKTELDTKLENLENLQVDTFTDDNQERIEKSTEEAKDIIEKLKVDIEKFNEDKTDLKEKIERLKPKK